MVCYEFHLQWEFSYRKDLIYGRIKTAAKYLPSFSVHISFYVLSIASFEHIALQDHEEVSLVQMLMLYRYNISTWGSELPSEKQLHYYWVVELLSTLYKETVHDL